jgi:hypothetical protein
MERDGLAVASHSDLHARDGDGSKASGFCAYSVAFSTTFHVLLNTSSWGPSLAPSIDANDADLETSEGQLSTVNLAAL